MKKKNNIERLDQREWAEIAARLSGEHNGSASAEDISDMERELQKKWNDIKMTYREKEIDTDKAWMNVSRRIAADEEKSEKTVIRPLFPLLMKAAASVIIVLGLGWAGWRLSVPKDIIVASSSTEKNITVTLPDGSTVWLNRSSRLTYPSKFGRDGRRVKLEGEAFFDVERDESKPFVIDAGNAEVKVLGTSFNVISDNGNKEVEVYVATGSVLVTSANGENSVTLKPGLVGRVSDRAGTRNSNEDENYLSWKTEILTYDGESLTSVFKDLKRAYNIDIKADDPEINNLTLTSVFDEQPHDTIIKVICTTFNLKYEKRGDSYLLTKK